MPEIDIDHVAHLARLDLTEAERATFAPQLERIVAYVDKLQGLDTEGIEASFQVVGGNVHNVFREDEIGPGLSPDEALANAPQRENGYFRVPRIL
jgi:aspartyl-tRNA(Asn)/glutamyl-tRNA(Gln) amidotransferase subunit C